MDLAFFRRHAFCIMIAARSISSCSAFKRRFMCNTIEPCFLRQASWILNAAAFISASSSIIFFFMFATMDLAFFRRHAFCIMIAARSISSCSAFKRRFMCNTIDPCFLRQASWILNAAVFNSSIYAFCASACCAFHRNIHMFSNRKSRTIQRTCFRAHPFRLSLIAETYLSNGMGALVDFSCATNGVHSCS